MVLSILDHFVRRNDDQERVIGTLLGVVNEAGEIEVRSSFPVPHSEKDDTVRRGLGLRFGPLSLAHAAERRGCGRTGAREHGLSQEHVRAAPQGQPEGVDHRLVR